MFSVFSRSWEITKTSFRVIKQDKELLIYPILSCIFSLIYSIALAFPILLFEIVQTGVPEEFEAVFQNRDSIYVFLWYFGLAFVVTFFNVCTVYTAKIRFEGGNATFWSSFKFAISRFFKILVWSMLSATVGVALYAMELFARKTKSFLGFLVAILRGLLAVSWDIVSIFVVPAFVYYDIGPCKGINKSIEIFQRTWGESAVKYYGLYFMRNVIEFFVILFSIILTIVLFNLFEEVGLLIGIGGGIMIFIIIALVFSIADKVYDTALFVYGDTGVIPGAFNEDIMQNAFRVKNQSAVARTEETFRSSTQR